MGSSSASPDISAVGSTIISEEEAKVYDRQIRLWGLDVQQRLSSTHLLVIGLSGINLEAAKNLILSGVRLTFCNGHIPLRANASPAHLADLHPSHHLYNFFAAPTVNRSASLDEVLSATVGQLKQLNPFVKVESLSDQSLVQSLSKPIDATDHPLRSFSTILVASECVSIDDIMALDNFCRNTNKGLFVTRSIGTHGAILQDFGPHYETGGQLHGKLIERRIISFPSFKEVFAVPVKDLPSGTKRPSNHPNLELLLLYALVKYDAMPDPPMDFIEFGVELFKTADVLCSKPESFIRNLLSEWKRLDGVAFPTSSAVLGGLLTQEVQRFISQEYRASNEAAPSFNNIMILNSDESEGLVFQIQIAQTVTLKIVGCTE